MTKRDTAGKKGTEGFGQFMVRLSKDNDTGQVVAEVPSLDLADYGIDSDEAILRLQEMVIFHLECLATEGKNIPSESDPQEGLYLRVKLPTNAS